MRRFFAEGERGQAGRAFLARGGWSSWSPWVWVALVHLVTSVGFAFVPLVNTFGYEYALATTLVVVLAHPWVFVWQTLTPLPPLPKERGGEEVAVVFGGLGALLPAFVVGFAMQVVTGFCHVQSGVAFFVFMPMVTAMVVTGYGRFAAAVVRSRAARVGVVVMLYVAGAVPLLARVYAHPPVFFFHPYAGYFPGPIYDTALRVDGALLRQLFTHAGFALGGAAGFVVLARLARRVLRGVARGVGGERVSGGVRVPVVIVSLGGVLAGVVLAGATAQLEAAFFMPTSREIEAELGATLFVERASEHGAERGAVPLIYDAQKMSEAKAKRIAFEAAFRIAEFEAFVGERRAAALTLFIYPDVATKKRLMGAGRTQIARPWSGEIHVAAEDDVPRALHHELAHALLGPYGAPPFGVPATMWGLLPNVALLEGAAVAAAWDDGAFSPHEAAAVMLDEKRLPRIATLVRPWGFWTESGPRAYLASGSFVRWLRETRGAEVLLGLYRRGDVEAVTGVGLDELEGAWRGWLSTQQVPDEARSDAQRATRRLSIFERRCARDVDWLLDAAALGDATLGDAGLGGAAGLLEEAVEKSGGETEVCLRAWQIKPEDAGLRGRVEADAVAQEMLAESERAKARRDPAMVARARAARGLFEAGDYGACVGEFEAIVGELPAGSLRTFARTFANRCRFAMENGEVAQRFLTQMAPSLRE